jgi:hypothetical protein
LCGRGPEKIFADFRGWIWYIPRRIRLDRGCGRVLPGKFLSVLGIVVLLIGQPGLDENFQISLAVRVLRVLGHDKLGTRFLDQGLPEPLTIRANFELDSIGFPFFADAPTFAERVLWHRRVVHGATTRFLRASTLIPSSCTTFHPCTVLAITFIRLCVPISLTPATAHLRLALVHCSAFPAAVNLAAFVTLIVCALFIIAAECRASLSTVTLLATWDCVQICQLVSTSHFILLFHDLVLWSMLPRDFPGTFVPESLGWLDVVIGDLVRQDPLWSALRSVSHSLFLPASILVTIDQFLPFNTSLFGIFELGIVIVIKGPLLSVIVGRFRV